MAPVPIAAAPGHRGVPLCQDCVSFVLLSEDDQSEPGSRDRKGGGR